MNPFKYSFYCMPAKYGKALKCILFLYENLGRDQHWFSLTIRIFFDLKADSGKAMFLCVSYFDASIQPFKSTRRRRRRFVCENSRMFSFSRTSNKNTLTCLCFVTFVNNLIHKLAEGDIEIFTTATVVISE